MRYASEIPYLHAILQTAEVSRTRAVYEAIDAMQQRCLTPVNRAGDVALTRAEAGVQLLFAEMTAKYV
jgi:hypothetical protein